MASEGDAPVPDVPEAEGLWNIVRTAVVEAAAAQYPAHTEYGSLHDAELHDGTVEVLGAGRGVDAVVAQHGRYEFLITFDRKKEDSPCNIFPHMVKVSLGLILFNTVRRGLTKILDMFYIIVRINRIDSRTEETYGRCYF